MPRAGLDSTIVTETAAAIIDAEGRGALSLARVAAELGVAPPSLYKHVASLDDLILRVTTLSIRHLTDELMAAAVGRSGRRALVAFAEAYRRFAVGHPGLYSLTQGSPDLDSTARQSEVSRANDVLRAAIGSYDVPDKLAIHAVRIVRAALHGFADIEVRGGFRMPHSVDASFRLLIGSLDASLKSLGRRSVEQNERSQVV